MGNVNMEAYQVHYEGKSVAEKLKELDAIAQQIEDLPTFTSNDRVFLEAVPAMPAEEGKTVLTATTDDQGNTELTYETPEVEGGDIAQVFDDATAYSEGDLVYYDGSLYKFDADHAAGTWDPTEVTQTSVAAEFKALKNTLKTVGDRIDANTISQDNAVALTYDTEYTTLSDGYFRIVCNGGFDTWATGKINNVNVMQCTSVPTQTANGMASIFVRKGSKIKYSGKDSTNTSGLFFPLT